MISSLNYNILYAIVVLRFATTNPGVSDNVDNVDNVDKFLRRFYGDDYMEMRPEIHSNGDSIVH
ncbi:hypothetical protein OS493_025464 [Desmophyllum pertusum]|uniref:Uncharacterized protein n=1 Tax=Desmophyllum pertusum TaxID=174260 RepID=A0A9W9YLD3_9CNID|nr:hypothetical protein OS493_025464 [Desmophyllum pertusum]